MLNEPGLRYLHFPRVGRTKSQALNDVIGSIRVKTRTFHGLPKDVCNNEDEELRNGRILRFERVNRPEHLDLIERRRLIHHKRGKYYTEAKALSPMPRTTVLKVNAGRVGSSSTPSTSIATFSALTMTLISPSS